MATATNTLDQIQQAYQAQQAQTANAAATNATMTPTATTPTAQIGAVNTQQTTAQVPATQGADIIMSPEDQAKIQNLQNQWQQATAAGNTAGAQAAHAAAEQLRMQYGYSGGAQGGQYLPSGTTGVTGADVTMSAADQAKIAQFQQQYAQASARGDQAAMTALHAAAEKVRAQYGFSGGAAGGGYTPVQATAPQYTPGQAPEITSNIPYINELSAAQQQAALSQLQTAYQTNLNTLQAQQGQLNAPYEAARRATIQSAQQQQRNFAEQAAASGLNVGAGGQAQLAMGNQLQQNLGNIAQQQANAQAALQLQMTQLNTKYQGDITQAVNNGNLQRAQSLLDEYNAQRSLTMQRYQTQQDEIYRAYTAQYGTYTDAQQQLAKRAETMAAIGDYSGLLALGYTQAQVDALTKAYKQANAPAATGGGGTRTPAAPKTPAAATPTQKAYNDAKAGAGNFMGYIGMGGYTSQQAAVDMANYLQGQVNNNAITYEQGLQIMRELKLAD